MATWAINKRFSIPWQFGPPDAGRTFLPWLAQERIAPWTTSLAFMLSGALALLEKRLNYLLRHCRSALATRAAAMDFRSCAKPALRVMELGFWLVAACTLGYCGYAYAAAAVHQSHEKAAFEALRAQRAGRSLLGASEPVKAAEPGTLLGILDIPRIGVSSIVDEGVDSQTLLHSVGHIPGTALPGRAGNTGLAGHRDTYFRGLAELRAGDVLTYHSPVGTYDYTVRSTRVIDPSDTHVLAASRTPTLTLVTCYPFDYVGSAPKRYIVVAELTASR